VSEPTRPFTYTGKYLIIDYGYHHFENISVTSFWSIVRVEEFGKTGKIYKPS